MAGVTSVLGDTRRGFSAASLCPPISAPGGLPLLPGPLASLFLLAPHSGPLSPLPPQPCPLRHRTYLCARALLPSANCLGWASFWPLWLCQTPPWGQGQGEAWADSGGDLQARACGSVTSLCIQVCKPPAPHLSSGVRVCFSQQHPRPRSVFCRSFLRHSGLFHRSVCGGPVRAPRCHNLLKCTHSEFQRLETETRGHLLASGLAGRGRGWQTPAPASDTGNLSRAWEGEQEMEQFGRAKGWLRLRQLHRHLQRDSEWREELVGCQDGCG